MLLTTISDNLASALQTKLRRLLGSEPRLAERIAVYSPQQFSWRALGVDIRGRSRTLRVNYRTTHQIRSQAECSRRNGLRPRPQRAPRFFMGDVDRRWPV